MCPLCDSSEFAEIGSLPLHLSLAAMGLDANVPEYIETPSGGPPPDIVHLHHCECGLQYFTPAAIGSAGLYRALATAGYYQPVRWDHRVALRLVQPGCSVLDLGCGDGAFIEAAADQGARACGVDFSVPEIPGRADIEFIAARADLRGTDYDVLLDRPRSTIVTSFQVVEHLEDPVTFVSRAATLVHDGGSLVISVPNRRRFEIDPTQPLDCPPHHQTRWTTEQLRTLGERCGLELRELRTQRVHNPLRIANRLIRRATFPSREEWPLPPSAGPWPPTRIVNGMSLVAVYGLT